MPGVVRAPPFVDWPPGRSRAQLDAEVLGRPDSKRADDALRGKCALIVDDDVRNLFAFTGLLEDAGMEVNAIPASTSSSWTS